MVNIVLRRKFIQFLKSEDFKEPKKYDNRREFQKQFYPGIAIDVVLFKDVAAYEVTAYFDMNHLFPALRFPDVNPVGRQYTESNYIRCPDDRHIDLNRFREIYEGKRRELNIALDTVRKIPKF